jgi:hypothetical protein
MTNKTKGWEELKKQFNIKFCIKRTELDGYVYRGICPTVTEDMMWAWIEKQISQALQDRDKQWLEAVGEEEKFEEPLVLEIEGKVIRNVLQEQLKADVRNQLRLEIKKKMEDK